MHLKNLFSPPKISMILLATIIVTTLPVTADFIMSMKTTIKEWQLINVSALILNLPILIDKTSMIFSTVVLTIATSVMLFTMTYMSQDKYLKYFVQMVLMFVLSMNMLIFLPNMITLLMGWDGLGLTSYLLVIYYMNDKSLAAGMLTALTNRIGDALLIFAAAMSFLYGQLNFTFSSLMMNSTIVLLILVSAMTKSAQIPFSAWLPAAMAAPTPVSALVHSSTLVTAGMYLMIRFYPSLSLYSNYQSFTLIIGVMTCLMASLAATFEMDLKKIIALSTLSQLGLMTMALGLNQPNLAFFHLVTHALFKALLFLCAGTIIHNSMNNQDIRLMGDIWKMMPLTTTTMNSANLALCGFPFMAGFYSKDSIIETLMLSDTNIVTSTLMIMSVVLTSVYTMRLSYITLWSPFKGSSMLVTTDESKVTHVAYSILLLGTTTMGATFYWMSMPMVTPMVLTTIMKILILTLVILLGTFSLVSNYLGKTIPGAHFMTSMWFLTFFSAKSMTSKLMSVSTLLQYNEMTWMEKMSGAGASGVLKETTKALQKTSNINFSQYLGITGFLLLAKMILY